MLAHLQLPIEPEAPPTNTGTRQGKEEKEWGNDDLKFEDADDQLDKILKDIKEKEEKIKERIANLQQQVESLQKLKEEVEDLKKRTGVSQQELADFNAEEKKIDDDIAKKKQKIKDYTDDYNKLVAQEKEMLDTIKTLTQDMPPGSGNISSNRSDLCSTK